MNGPLQVVVSRTGTATVAWMVVPGGEHYFGPNYVAVGDDPPGPGDPHYPPRPPDAQNPLDAQYDGVLPADQPGESLAIDGADVQTLIWFEDLLTPPGPNQDYTEFYDVVASDRALGGGWSSPPRLRIGFVSYAPLAVNSSGAAVVAWWEIGADGKHTYTYASYRSARGAGWTPAKRVPHAQISGSVGIDDAGRILLLYLPVKTNVEQVIRRTATGRWGMPQPVTPRRGGGTQLAVGADGAAVVTYSTGDYPDQTLFTRRMSPAGHWGSPIRQPSGHAVGLQSVDVDARGRALIAWWNGTDLLARWSRPGGRWLKTCVLAAAGSKQRSEELNPQVVVNPRGDALVVWRVSGRPGRVGQLWARYQRAGHAWGKPIRVTPADGPPRGWFAAGLGEGGVGAVAWTTRDNREIQVRRLSPTQ